ncbi:MAG TPA: GatB/YqeY domain-containing protein [Ktedonobacterales bacterium]|nr:GatB/YqeY domain-containing protein [Ktedonobacterales bacterium]
MTAPNTQTLEERLKADVKDAMRAKDQVRVDTLRLALNAFHLEDVARTDKGHKLFRQPLSEADRLAILEKQVKQREEAAEIYRTAGRAEAAAKEQREAELLSGYLPAPLTDEELRALVAAIVTREGKEFRKVMPLAAKETKGRAEGKRVQEIVRELTA